MSINLNRIKKQHHWNAYDLWMWVIVIAGVLLRLVLISNHWPLTNSDEAVMDLMAKHIVEHGEWTVFFYGQAYMGPVEAYLGAALMPIFGISTATVRLGLVLFFALFLIAMYYLTRLLYNKQLALATIGLLSLGSFDMFLHQLRAIGGYPEIVVFGAMLFLIASHLVLTAESEQQATNKTARYRRWLLFALLGLLAGLAIWIDEIILPWIFTTVILLLLFCRHELKHIAGVCALGGLLLGALPLIIYNISAPAGHSSIEALAGLQHAGADVLVQQHIPFFRGIIGAILYAIPAITGFNPLCTPESLPFFGPVTANMWSCTTTQGVWSLGYIVLWCSAAYLAGRTVWQQWRQNHHSRLTGEELRTYTLQWARLLLLLSAMLTLFSYITSPSAALVPGPTSRYLICTQIAIPALLWPLWNGFRTRLSKPTSKLRPTLLVRIAVLLLIEVMLLVGTVRTFNDMPNTQAAFQAENTLVHDLENIDATRVYTDYWTCYQLVFQSNEKILCTPLDDGLVPGQDRYKPYTLAVQSVSQPFYVFSSNAPQVPELQQQLQTLKIPYKYYTFDGYVAYQLQRPLVS